MKRTVINIIKAVVSLALTPLMFLKTVTETGWLPNAATGEVVKKYYHYSIYENLFDTGKAFLAYAALALLLLSAALSFVSIAKKESKKAYIASWIVFALALTVLAAACVFALAVSREY